MVDVVYKVHQSIVEDRRLSQKKEIKKIVLFFFMAHHCKM